MPPFALHPTHVAPFVFGMESNAHGIPDYLLSNNHINDIITHDGYDFANEELLAYVVRSVATVLRVGCEGSV